MKFKITALMLITSFSAFAGDFSAVNVDALPTGAAEHTHNIGAVGLGVTGLATVSTFHYAIGKDLLQSYKNAQENLELNGKKAMGNRRRLDKAEVKSSLASAKHYNYSEKVIANPQFALQDVDPLLADYNKNVGPLKAKVIKLDGIREARLVRLADAKSIVAKASNRLLAANAGFLILEAGTIAFTVEGLNGVIKGIDAISKQEKIKSKQVERAPAVVMGELERAN